MDTDTFLLARCEIQERLERRRQTADSRPRSSRNFSLWPMAGWMLNQALKRTSSSFLKSGLEWLIGV